MLWGIVEHSFSRLFVPKTIRSHGGSFILRNDSFPGPFVPGNIRSRERMNPGPFVPRTIRSLEHSFLIIKSCETSFFNCSWSSGAQIFINYGDNYFYFRRVFYIRCDFCFRSGFYFRNCGTTLVTPYLWPKDHGGGHFCATDGAMTHHYRHRRELSGRWIKSDSLPRLI